MSADLGHWTTPRRPIPGRLVDFPEPGEHYILTLESLPAKLLCPVVKSRATFVAESDPPPVTAPRFAAREFHLRVTAADHLGPTEAEYREVTG